MKVVTDAQGRVIAFGPNDENYSPGVPDGATLAIQAKGAVELYIEPAKPVLTLEMLANAILTGDTSELQRIAKEANG